MNLATFPGVHTQFLPAVERVGGKPGIFYHVNVMNGIKLMNVGGTKYYYC